MKANTWGSRGSRDAPAAATEANVLREIASCVDLGVDALEIDDGWQHDPRGPAFTPKQFAWRPHAGRFPGGWGTVRSSAAEAGVDLLLWASGNANTADLLWNIEAGGFRGCKLDFLDFKVREDLDAFVAKARQLCVAGGPRFQVNTDSTENMNRVGYFFAREFGPLYLANRERVGLRNKHVVYQPHLVLRDAWHLARYVNLNQVLLSFVDHETVPAELSDAGRYGHAYNFAITMMGLPLLFMETQFLSAAARDELRPLVRLYKQHREAIFDGIVSPLGDEPDGASWSGFVSHDAAAGRGHVTLFRELHNDESHKPVSLPMLPDRPRRWFDLGNGRAIEVARDGQDRYVFDLERPASFVFLAFDDGSLATEQS